MRLIAEHIHEIEFVTEAETGGKMSQFIQGIFAQAEVANKNKRIYPLSVLENEVKRYTMENINEGRAYGELGHPIGPNINLDRVCILIKEMKQSGNDFIGKAKILSTPFGNTIRGMIDEGCKLGVSTRALGSLKPRDGGINEVQADLRLLAVDVVADPSAPKAFINGIMEGTGWVWDAARQCYLEQHIDDVQKQVKKLSAREVTEHQVRLFGDFLNRLGNYYQR